MMRRAPAGCRAPGLRNRIAPVALATLLALPLAPPPAAAAPAGAGEAPWRALLPGLELGRFADDAGDVVVLRVDPRRFELTLLQAGQRDDGAARSPRAWAAAEGLVAATNAGMYATDMRTHVGLLQDGDRPGNPHANGYQSAAAFAPRRAGLPPFRIFDLDDSRLEEIRRDYACVVQNLRLVKRPGENRWSPQERSWSEAALGEDREGRALLIFSPAPRPMDELVELLLALPIGLVAAQHLEGGSEAQLWIGAGGESLELVGGGGGAPWPLPNVIGVRAPAAVRERR
jgi:hypothetical protein